MSTSHRYRVAFRIREGSAGLHFLSIEPERDDYRETLGCDTLRLFVRDGVDFATLEALARDLDACVEALSFRTAATERD